MPEWNGTERRQQPHDYADMRQMIREEFSHLADEHAEIRQKQQEIERKIAQWETGAFLFRWFVVATAATLTAAAGVRVGRHMAPQGRDAFPTGEESMSDKLGIALREASTWRGLVLLATALGLCLDPEQEDAIVAAGLAIAGLIGVFFRRHA